MRNNPFQQNYRKFKPKKDKVSRDGRIQLANKSELRLQVAERADYRCEAILNGKPCNRFAPLEGRVGVRGELAHKSHGSGFRSDTPEECLWKCHTCHQEIEHGTPKYPRRSGKKMNSKQAKEYFENDICFCSEGEKIVNKPKFESFCAECKQKLPKQMLYNLEHPDLTRHDAEEVYRELLAECENMILLYDLEHKDA